MPILALPNFAVRHTSIWNFSAAKHLRKGRALSYGAHVDLLPAECNGETPACITHGMHCVPAWRLVPGHIPAGRVSCEGCIARRRSI